MLDWCVAAATLAVDNDLPVDAVRIGHIDGDLFDPRLAWAQFRGITARGAVLVRPDRVLGWRSAVAAANAAGTLAEALGGGCSEKGSVVRGYYPNMRLRFWNG